MKQQILILFLLSLVVSCSSRKIQNKSVVGELFPEINGISLFGDRINLPASDMKDPQIFLIGYKQKSQFDIDRWLIGFEMTGVKVLIYELPVLDSWFPTFLRKKIDGGMKKGIPKGLWKNVVTVYDDADIIKNFLGTENPNNARVLLVGNNKKVLAQFDDGFSSGSLVKILKLIPKNKQANCRDLLD